MTASPNVLLLSLKQRAVFSEVIEKINALRSLKLEERTLTLEPLHLHLIELLKLIKTFPIRVQEELFSSVDAAGQNVLMNIIQTVPLALPIVWELIQTFSSVLQVEFFKNTISLNGMTALMILAQEVPAEFSKALELIKKFPVAAQEEIFQQVQVDRGGRNILGYLNSFVPPWAILTLLKLIKKLSPQVRDKIINHKDSRGVGLEFYLVSNGNIELLEIVRAMGFNFNREAKDKIGKGLLEEAVRCHKCEMLKVLISEYGLKPNIETLVPYAEDKGVAEVINCCRPEHLAQLYAAYLNSLHRMRMDNVENELVAIPKALISMVSGYLAFDSEDTVKNQQEIAVVEASIRRALTLRAEWLKPLFDHCAQEDADAQALTCLKTLLASKKLGPYALEKELDALLTEEGLAGKSHAFSLIQCRWNTEKFTGNKFNFSVRVKATFQFKVLCDCAITSVLSLAIGIITLCIFNAVAVGIAISALSSIALGGAAYGLYAHKRNTAIPEFAAPAPARALGLTSQ